MHKIAAGLACFNLLVASIGLTFRRRYEIEYLLIAAAFLFHREVIMAYSTESKGKVKAVVAQAVDAMQHSRSWKIRASRLWTNLIQLNFLAMIHLPSLRFNATTGYRIPFAERRILLILVDAMLIVAALWGAHFFAATISDAQIFGNLSREHWHWYPLSLAGWWLLAAFNDLYDIPSCYDWIALSVRLLVVGLLAAAIYVVTTALFDGGFSNYLFFYFLMLAFFSLMIWRFSYVRLSQTFLSPHRVLIIGLGERSESIARLLSQQAKHLRYLILGYISDTDGASESQRSELSVIGQVSNLPALVQQYAVHEVVVAMEQALTEDTFRLLIVCQAQGIKVTWMPDLYEKLGRRIPIEHIDPIWALCAIQSQPIFSPLQLISKRMLDLIILFFALPSLIFLLPLLAIAIRLDSSGPIFYRQIRSGRGGKPFSILKFRTMIADAEKDGKPRWASKNDARITRVGRFLRKTRLDELPQLINILTGEMSIVGPRPERPEFVDELQKVIPFYPVRLMVKPGLTGWAQIHYEYGNSVQDALLKLQYDFYYIHYWSLWLDLYTMFKTISVVLKFKGM